MSAPVITIVRSGTKYATPEEARQAKLEKTKESQARQGEQYREYQRQYSKKRYTSVKEEKELLAKLMVLYNVRQASQLSL